MQAHGIQGRALTIIKVLLRKSSLTKFFNSTVKTSQEPYMNLPWSVMRSWTSYQTLSQIQLKFYLLTTMMNSELSLHNRGATMIRTDYNPAGNSRPHDICRSPTYIYQPTLGSSKQEQVRVTREYSTLPIQPIATWVHAIPTISPLPVRE